MTNNKYEVNPPMQSKINAVALVAIMTGLAVNFGFVDDELADKIKETAVVLVPALTFILRTWFTNPKF